VLQAAAIGGRVMSECSAAVMSLSAIVGAGGLQYINILFCRERGVKCRERERERGRERALPERGE